MSEFIDQDRGDAWYRRFYSSGGWKYSFLKEYLWHRRQMARRFGLRRGARMLEIACGNGFHTNLFCRMGFDCVGIDRSEAGIAWARRHFPRRVFHCCDFREIPYEAGSFDVVVARGFSFYHYDLSSDEARWATQTSLKHVAPGGLFIMMIITDLSGRRPADGVWQNTLDDYRRHFQAFDRPFTVDWADGMAICGVRNVAVDRGVSSAALVTPAQVAGRAAQPA